MGFMPDTKNTYIYMHLSDDAIRRLCKLASHWYYCSVGNRCSTEYKLQLVREVIDYGDQSVNQCDRDELPYRACWFFSRRKQHREDVIRREPLDDPSAFSSVPAPAS